MDKLPKALKKFIKEEKEDHENPFPMLFRMG
jgi:hypothetical protein